MYNTSLLTKRGSQKLFQVAERARNSHLVCSKITESSTDEEIS